MTRKIAYYIKDSTGQLIQHDGHCAFTLYNAPYHSLGSSHREVSISEFIAALEDDYHLVKFRHKDDAPGSEFIVVDVGYWWLLYKSSNHEPMPSSTLKGADMSLYTSDVIFSVSA